MGFFSRRRRSWLLVAALASACALGSAFVLTSRSSADADQAAITAIISDFQQAEAARSDIPADAVSEIQARLADLQPISDGSADDSGSPVEILPTAVKEKMNRAKGALLNAFCSQAFQRRHEHDARLSDIVEAGLYNNPQQTLVVREQTEVLASPMLKDDGETAIVWAYSWWGDVTASGHGCQGWDVSEYRMIKEDGAWKVDRRSPLVSAESTSAEWGPHAPHTSIANAEQEGPSALYPDQAIPRDQLQAVVDMAVPDK